MEDKELELQRWQDIILNHLDSQMELDELTDFMDSNVILVEGQMNMLERMIYPSDSNPYLQHIDWTFGREPIQTIIDNGYYGIEDKEMLNNLREHYIRYTKKRS
jgi:hypothetical protein